MCGKNVKFSGQTTSKSNLLRHLREWHKNVSGTKSKTGQGQTHLTALGFAIGEKKYSPTSTKKKELDSKLALMIARDMRPVQMIQGAGFIDFVHTLDPRYQVSFIR